MENILKKFLEIIGSFVDAYTVCFFEIEKDYLKLKYFFSLSNNLKRDVKIKVGESIIGWIAKHKKPVNIKGDSLNYKILEIYDKDEEIKTYFIQPVEDKGVLYIDSKRSYSITEKYQKILIYCAKFFSNLINFENRQKEFKSVLKTIEIIKKLDYKNFLNYICKYYNFEAGVIFKREEDRFIIINSNNKKISDLEKNKIGILLKKNIHKITFLENDNVLIIPIESHNLLVGGFIFFNGKFNKELESLKKIFELKFYEEVFKFEAYKKFDKIMTIENFLLHKKEYSNYCFILIKINNFYRLICNFSEKIIIKALEKSLYSLEKAFNTKFGIIKVSPNIYSLMVKKELLKKIENFIEKNFKNTYLKINNQQVKIKCEIHSFYEETDFLKFIFK